MESFFETDKKIEREVCGFLDENLYTDSDIFSSYIRIDSKKEQFLGCDVLLTTIDNKLNCSIVDEKVAARYANSDLNTFALEISFIDKQGDEKDGWFIDKEKKNQYYLFGWITASMIPFDNKKWRFQTEFLTKENICSIDWALISKDKIFTFLGERGWTLEKIKEQAKRIRKRGYIITNDYVDGITYRYTKGLAEKPINLLMLKKTYFDLAEYNGTITNKKLS